MPNIHWLACLTIATLRCSPAGPLVQKAGVQVHALSSPADVTSIRVSVTGGDFAGSRDADLAQQMDGSWLGAVEDVPPGSNRTVTAEAFVGTTRTFSATATNVEVLAGTMTEVTLTLLPVGAADDPGLNTAPAFTAVSFPQSVRSNATASLSVTAADPDANTLLSYTWSVLQGGGSVSPPSTSNQRPGEAVTAVYTPVPGFVGFAVIQVSVFDGTASSSTTFPISVGGGIDARIAFVTLPNVTVSSIERQTLMAADTSQISYALSNPSQPWSPSVMHVNTTWSDSCGGVFDGGTEPIDLNVGESVSRVVTYTAPSQQPLGTASCELSFTVTDDHGVQERIVVYTWLRQAMVMFVSSAWVAGDTFGGRWQVADAFCQGLADAPTSVAPPGIYRALVSFDSISAKDRLIDAPFIRTDGTRIARNKTQLFSANLSNAVRTNENGVFTGVAALYTGTNGDGSKGQNCLNWTSTDGNTASTAGINATATNPNWINSGTFTCSALLSIYCVQQPY